MKSYIKKKRNKNERKEGSFCKIFVKVKLVLVNIRFKLDISMPVMVTNPGIGFGTWHLSSLPAQEEPLASFPTLP